MLSGAEDLTSVILVDITPLSLGIETVGGVMTPIVKRSTTLPTKRAQTFSTHQDNQSTVTTQVYVGERSMNKDNHMLGKFELTGIPPAPRGVPQIEVTFKVDANGFSKSMPRTREPEKPRRLSLQPRRDAFLKDEIERMVHEAEEFAEERIDARDAMESYLFNQKHLR